MLTNQPNESPGLRNNSSVRRYRSRLKPFAGRPDLTALINVMFLLLIFFILSGPFLQVSGIRVDLPRVDASTSADIEKFIIAVSYNDGESRIYFNDVAVDWEELKKELSDIRDLSPTAAVVIRADRRVPSEIVTQIMALAENARVASFIAVMPSSQKSVPLIGDR